MNKFIEDITGSKSQSRKDFIDSYIQSFIVASEFDESLDESTKSTIMVLVPLLTRNKQLCNDLSSKIFLTLSEYYDTVKNSADRKLISDEIISSIAGNPADVSGNTLLNDWVIWAKEACFVDSCECSLMTSSSGFTSRLKRNEQTQTAWAIPSTVVLKYMANTSKIITEIGSGRGYWAKLLRACGLHVIAVDSGADLMPKRPLIKDTKKMDGIHYVAKGYVAKSSLLFCYPQTIRHGGYYVEEILSIFQGDTFYFVGELNNGATFDIGDWHAKTGEQMGWTIAYRTKLPCYCGIRDEFLHFTKRI